MVITLPLMEPPLLIFSPQTPIPLRAVAYQLCSTGVPSTLRRSYRPYGVELFLISLVAIGENPYLAYDAVFNTA